jgi:hypothetical protein
MLSDPQPRGYYCRKFQTPEPAGLKYSQCSACKIARYCSKACQIADWSSHKVFIQSTLIFKGGCAKLKVDREQGNNPSLRRKFRNWKDLRFALTSSLTLSLMHPICKIRLETYAVVIGFQVISAEVALIEDPKRYIRENILSNQTNHPERVCFEVMFQLDDDASRNLYFSSYGVGDYSYLAAIQDKAATESFRQVELIKMLNKEL